VKARKDEILTIVLFCGFLSVMLLCYLLLPKKDFSEKEKRYLEKAPVFSGEELLSGKLSDSIEKYMADHIPGRDFFVGLDAYVSLLSGRQITGDVRLLTGERIVEAPVEWNETAVQKNVSAILSFADSLDRPIDFMIIPSAGWASDNSRVATLDFFGQESYADEQHISSVYGRMDENVRCMDTLNVMRGREELYYRTDHHWTSEGAYEMYRAYMTSLNRKYLSKEEFTVESVPGFRGSTYSRSALWNVSGEDLELWHSGTELLVTNGESDDTHKGVFYRQRLEENDKYTVYLDGNHSIVRIENPAMAGAGKLLVIRDSYSNSLGCFLAESYETVVLVDMRYYKKPASQLCAQEEFADILVCYSIGNFMSDTNLVWLR